MRYLMLFLIIATSGCATSLKQKRELSSMHMRCPAEQIKIKDRRGGSQVGSWEATCNGVSYFCDAAIGGSTCRKVQ